MHCSIEMQQMMEQNNRVKTRDSNIELYRIIAMLLIVAHHYVANSGLTAAEGPIFANPLSWRSAYLLLLGAWGKTGINCFVLITGYYMCKSHITLKKYLRLLFEVLFYRIVIAAIFWMTGYEPITAESLAKTFIPVRSVADGFVSAFLVFYLFIPFLNILVHNMDEKMHIRLLALCGFVYIFLGTVPGFTVNMNYVSWFIVLYFISSYIRMYPKDVYTNTSLWCLLAIISFAISGLSVILILRCGGG